MDNKEINDTLIAANLYLKRLEILNNELENAEEQINRTCVETEKEIEVIFKKLQENIINSINKRRKHLLDKLHSMKDESLKPLQKCSTILLNKIHNTNELINQGKYLLNGHLNNLSEFSDKASLLGSLPEIPELKEVPYISFQFDQNTENELCQMCSEFGTLSRIAPIQISQLSEKPGAILVEWQSIENDEHFTDIQEFRLQKAYGDVTVNKHLFVNFSDCFRGLDTQYLVKDLSSNQPYSFRVCCKFEACSEWSPWSLPQVSTTSIPSFSWQLNDDYILSNENKIANSIKESPKILLSDGPQFRIGYSVEFTFLEADNQKEAIIGLIKSRTGSEIKDFKSCNNSYFAIDQYGEIYVDGIKKATKLPEFSKGLKVCFTCELVGDDKVMVNIDSCDKRVTYEWQVLKNDKFYFAACSKSTEYKIMVE